MKNTITLASGSIPPREDRISVELSEAGRQAVHDHDQLAATCHDHI
jgi:hypothetical protein